MNRSETPFNGVSFITEGGCKVGMGHISRSITVARALLKSGVPVEFRVNNDSSVKALLERAGLPYVTGDFDSNCSAKELGTVIVIDTKRDLAGTVGKMQASGKRVVVLDNSSANRFSDSVIIPSAIFMGSDLKESGGEFPAGGADKVYGGSDYVIVGENFVELRRTQSRKKREQKDGPLKVLVTMGGADPNGLSELLTEALAGLYGIEVDVVIGPAAKPSESMRKIISAPPPYFTFHSGIDNLAPLAAGADIAFTALGITVYELASIGVPSILVGNYLKDVKEMAVLESTGICRSLGFFEELSIEAVQSIVEYFAQERDELARMGDRAKVLIDGDGAHRVAGILCELFYSLNAPVMLNGTRGSDNGVGHA